jgi:hypothetical protein
LIENTAGDITASVAGAAAAAINYDAGSESEATTGTVNLTASNTGGLTTTIINGAVSADGSSSTITLGDAATGKTNAVTLDGISDTITVNGGSGKDTVAFASGNTYLNGTFALGAGGADAIDFTNLDATGANKTAYNGLVINLSSSAVTFDSGTATETSVASGAVKGYDDDAASTLSNVDAKGGSFTVSGIENVTGTGNADYIAAANTGSTITGGAGADTIVLGAGADTVVFNSSATADTITGFTTTSDTLNVDGVLTDGDVTLVSSAFTTYAASGTTGADNAIIVNTGAAALSTANSNAALIALFEAHDGNDAAKMALADGANEFIVLHQDADATSGTDFDAQLFLLKIAANDTITAELLGTINETGDSAVLVVGDFA